MKGKEEMLNTLRNDFQSLNELVKALRIQYYQGKLILDELIAEGKAESARFGKRLRYRKKTQVINLTIAPISSGDALQ